MKRQSIWIAIGLSALAGSAPAAQPQATDVLSTKPVVIFVDKANRAHLIADGLEIGVADNFHVTTSGAGGTVGRPVDADAINKIPPHIRPYAAPKKDWAKYGIDAKAGAASLKLGAVTIAHEH
jgi:hypothetical protein